MLTHKKKIRKVMTIMVVIVLVLNLIPASVFAKETEPPANNPGPNNQALMDPAPTDPEPTDPEPTDPEPTDPEPTDPIGKIGDGDINDVISVTPEPAPKAQAKKPAAPLIPVAGV